VDILVTNPHSQQKLRQSPLSDLCIENQVVFWAPPMFFCLIVQFVLCRWGKYLAENNILMESEEEFKRHAQNSWFRFYNKEGARDSSLAFEHVFVGEIKRQTEVSGFHNGIQLPIGN